MMEEQDFTSDGEKPWQEVEGGAYKITLQYPIGSGEAKLEHVTMRRAKAKDLRTATKSGKEADMEYVLLTNLCGLSPAELDALDIVDYRALQEAFVEMGKRKPGRGVMVV